MSATNVLLAFREGADAQEAELREERETLLGKLAVITTQLVRIELMQAAATLPLAPTPALSVSAPPAASPPPLDHTP